MSNKFTEEQYQKIVETVNKYPDFGSVYYVQNGWVESKPTNTFNELIKALSYTVSGESEVNRMLALANPLTREWAHDQYVEKEKQYVWTSKKPVTRNGNGFEIYKRLYRTLNGDVSDVLKGKNEYVYEEEYLTETDIKEWGYNPEMFDNDEVD